MVDKIIFPGLSLKKTYDQVDPSNFSFLGWICIDVFYRGIKKTKKMIIPSKVL